MATRKKQVSRIAELFSTSEECVNDARRAFEIARTTVVNAQTYGTAAHVATAQQLYQEAAESYADALRTHARLVVDYARENS